MSFLSAKIYYFTISPGLEHLDIAPTKIHSPIDPLVWLMTAKMTLYDYNILF